MDKRLTIGKAARISGLAPKTIRFYEDTGLLPPAYRSESGYRLYTEADVARLALVRRARMLDIDLASIKGLLDRAVSESCGEFGDELTGLLRRHKQEVERRIAELTALRDELDVLQGHVTHCCEGCDTDQMASECAFCCLIIDARGGEELASNEPSDERR